jgi:predicted cupin superfamily sugar epimerase
MPSASDIIARLELKPHPEGGYYRETFRDFRADAQGRAMSTAIYYLLGRGDRSHWHRIDAVEIWHYYSGAALTLQAIVPAGAWQSAESSGDWTLVGCTVAPAFEFARFEMAEKDWQPA